MNNDPNRPRRDDNVAATPVADTNNRRFNPSWLLLLLLIPLLLLPFCHHRDNAPTAAATPTPSSDVVNPAGIPSQNTAIPSAANPFTLNTTGPDLGKAVLNFDANTTTPNAASLSTLNAVVTYLQANPAARISLAGYTDNSGSAEVNKQLTQQRVTNVKSALTGAGVDASRIATANFGEAYPVTDNTNPQARELNRRVEITLAK